MPFANSVVGGAATLVRKAIQSLGFITGVTGWQIRRDGGAELNNVTVRGSIIVGTAGGARIEIGPGDTISLFDSGNHLIGTIVPGSITLEPNQQITAYELDTTNTKPNVIIGNGFGVYVTPNFNGATASFVALGYIPPNGESSLTFGPDQTRTSWNGLGVFTEQEQGGTNNLDQIATVISASSPGPAVTAYDTAIRVISQSHDTTVKSRVDIGAWSLRLLDTWTGGQNVFLTIDNSARTAQSKHRWNLSEALAATDALQVQVDGDASPRFAVRADGLHRIRTGAPNATAGTAVLVAGSVTVPLSTVDANSMIFVTCQIPGGAPGALRIDSRINGTSFTIKSTSVTDTSTVAWWLVEGF